MALFGKIWLFIVVLPIGNLRIHIHGDGYRGILSEPECLHSLEFMHGLEQPVLQSGFIAHDEIEGLVLRKKNSSITNAGSKEYDVSWIIRCRKPHSGGTYSY